jgi:hypothetical protein
MKAKERLRVERWGDWVVGWSRSGMVVLRSGIFVLQRFVV